MGWSKASAGNTITVFSGFMLLGSIPMALLSDKLHTRKGVLIVSISAAGGLPAVNTIRQPYLDMDHHSHWRISAQRCEFPLQCNDL